MEMDSPKGALTESTNDPPDVSMDAYSVNGDIITTNVESRVAMQALATKRRATDSTDATPLFPKTWSEEAFKAFKAYREVGYCRAIINALVTLAFGEAITAKSVDGGGSPEDINRDIRAKKILSHVKRLIVDALVKGDMVAFYDSDRGMARQVNPISIVPRYRNGELESIDQVEVDKSGKQKTAKGTTLALENTYHAKWDGADYEDHGNSMLVAAFADIEALRDYIDAERANAKRWANLIAYWQVGGVFGPKVIMPKQADIDGVQETINNMDKRSHAVVPFWVKGQLLGAEGEALNLEPRIRLAQEGIAVATNFPRTLLTGDGATFSTAEVASKKLALMLDAIRELGFDYLDWLMRKMHGEDVVVEWGHRGFSQFSAESFKQVIATLVDQCVISRRTGQKWLNLNPDAENAEAAKDEVRIKGQMTAQDIIGLVSIRVLTPQQGADLLGVEYRGDAAAVSTIYENAASPGSDPTPAA